MLTTKNQILLRRRIYLLLGACGLLFVGVIYAWAILKEPLAEEFQWTSPQLALNYTLTLVFNCIGNLLAGALSGKLPRRFVIACSATLLLSGFSFSSGLTGESILKLYIFYGCMCGLGIGMFTVTINAVVGDWFPDRKGLCSSILQTGFGLSALIIGSAASHFIKMPAVGWRKVYLVLGILTGFVLYLVALFVRSPSGTVPLPTAEDCGARRQTEAGHGISPGQMIRRSGFRRYYLFCFLIYCIGSAVIGLSTDIFYGVQTPASAAVFLVGLISVFNLLGRFSAGVLFDRFGRRSVMLYALILAALGTLLLTVSFFAGSIPVCAAGACTIGASYGCIPSSTSPIIREAFGCEYFTSNYSVALTSALPASFMATAAGMILAGTGSFYLLFGIFGMFTFAALIMFIKTKEL